MATRPVICPYIEPEGIKFERTNLVIDSNNMANPQVLLMLEDLIFDVPAYSKSTINLKGGTCALISQADIADPGGYVSFVAVKANYPAGTLEKDKFVTWSYRSEEYYMGELLVLSGANITTFDSEEYGWNLTKPGPIYQDGGITICNPHTDKRVILEVLVCR
jgi:hypothetical protein